MARSYQGVVGPGNTGATFLEWNALAEPSGITVDERGRESLIHSAANAWNSSMVTLTINYVAVAMVNGNPIPILEPVLNQDLRGVFVRVEFRTDLTCGNSQTVEFDLIQGATLSLIAEKILVTIVYPNTQQTPLPPVVGNDPVLPPLLITAQIAHGTARNSFVARRTIAAPINAETGFSLVQRVPMWASTCYIENGVLANVVNEIDFLTAANGLIVHAANIGKLVPGQMTGCPNGAPYFRLALNNGDATARVVFILQM